MTALRKSLIALSLSLSVVCFFGGWKAVLFVLVGLVAVYLYLCAILFLAESLARASERQRKDSERRERLAILCAWAEEIEENARLRKQVPEDDEAPFALDYNNTDYIAASDGRHVA